MGAWFKALPFFVLLMGISGTAMLVPSLHALGRNDHATSRIFLYGAILTVALTLLIGLATSNRAAQSLPRGQLTSLLGAFALLPLLFAVPFHAALGTTSFLNAWFEMVSSFTTTGATVYDNPSRLNPSLHLWRALIGWLGGLLVWVTAISVLAPMNLGGFEVQSATAVGEGERSFTQISRVADPSERLARYGMLMVPVYTGLTGALWIGLRLAGEDPFVAICHAMSVLSTSGISPVGGLQRGTSGFAGEVVIFAFLFFAMTRRTFSRGLPGDDGTPLRRDPELRMGLAFVIGVPTLLFLLHFVSSFDDSTRADLPSAGAAFWGGLFTVMSFLTTTGFESSLWLGATEWSGLATPGLVLVGLSLVGGGIATTAGGVKLMRIYALFRHGERELERVLHPSSVGGAGAAARRIRRKGAYIAWIFFMLFALSIVVVMLALSLTGLQFEVSMILSIAALSTTGPLAAIAAEWPISYAGIPDAAKLILAAAMVLGRLETLAIIALLNPDFWRR